MPVVTFNFTWMSLNLVLAFIPVLLVYVWKKNPPPVVSVILLAFWLLFVPNTIYLLTDLQYLPHQLSVSPPLEQFVIIIQYLILTLAGLFTYFYSLSPLVFFIKRLGISKKNSKYFIIIVNFILAFGVVLGKVERTHSWYVFTQTSRVLKDISTVGLSLSLLVLVILIGVGINVIYFTYQAFRIQKKVKRKKRR